MTLWQLATAPYNPATAALDARAIRRRLMGVPRPKTVLQVVTEIKQTLVYRPKPVYPVRMDADAHVWTWREHLTSERSGARVSEYIKARCYQLGVSHLPVIRKGSRKKIHVKPRHLLIHEVHVRYPAMSYTQIGQQFGGMDHTSILNALRKYGHVCSSVGKVTPEMADEMRRLYAEGVEKNEIGRRLGVSGTTVTSHVDPVQAAEQRRRINECKRRAAAAKKARAAGK